MQRAAPAKYGTALYDNMFIEALVLCDYKNILTEAPVL